MGVLEYSSNNSGGNWWLKLEDWQHLEEAGWIIHWIHGNNDPDHEHAEPFDLMEHKHSYSDVLVRSVWNGETYLDAAASSAAIETDNPDEAIHQFEVLTRQSADAEGCNCCGRPHYFTWDDSGGKKHYLDSRPSSYERKWS